VLYIYCYCNNFRVLLKPPENMTQMYNKQERATVTRREAIST
jgi:hypothetical protein